MRKITAECTIGGLLHDVGKVTYRAGLETGKSETETEFVAAFKAIAEEARTNPEIVKTAPHNAALATQIQEEYLTEWEKFATTWRGYLKYVKK